MGYDVIDHIDFQGGLDVSAPPLSPVSMNALGDGSWNHIISGSGHVRPWGGTTFQGFGTGSRKMLPFGNTWGGIKDAGATLGSGSFFQDIGKSRWGIGAGTPHIEGTSVTSWTLSSNLQLSIATAGSYATPVAAGLAQPSAPTVGIVPASVGTISNSVSAKIARSRPSTGAISVASPTSAVIVPIANTVRVTFPAASTGQTHWRVYFTFQGFGGTGVHYLAVYSTLTDIPEATVASGTVDGVARSLEFNYKDGDLIPLEASFDDYPPPAATHALRLQNVLNLVGCYADSSSAPTSTNTGTAIAVSKENNYESYVPTSLLFLPEQVVDTLARPIDDYGYIACQGSIHALQYVGTRGGELPSCTITTILPDIGIQYPHNWCHFRGRLLLYTAQGTLLMMDEQGGFDADFAGGISKILKTFTPATTVLGYDPQTDSIVVMNGVRIMVYSLQAKQWRQIWLPDYQMTDIVVSCVAAKRSLYFTTSDAFGGSVYKYDTSTPTVGISFCSNYRWSGGASVNDIYEMAVAAQTNISSQNALAVVINSNLIKTAYRNITATASSPSISDTDSSFETGINGKKFILFGTNIGGSGVHWMQGVLAYVNSSTATMSLNGSPIAPQVSLTTCLMFVGDYAAIKTNFTTTKHFPNFNPYMAEVRSHQVAVWFRSSSDVGNLLSVDLLGNQYPSSRAL